MATEMNDRILGALFNEMRSPSGPSLEIFWDICESRGIDTNPDVAREIWEAVMVALFFGENPYKEKLLPEPPTTDNKEPEVKITPEMIEAGVEVFYDLFEVVTTESLVTEIYEAMHEKEADNQPSIEKN